MVRIVLVTFTQPPMTLDTGQSTESDATWRTYTQEGMDSLKAGQIRLLLFTHVTYDDIFGRPHEAESCGWLNTTLSAFVACEENFNQSR
jgi:hypothetical protein